MTEQTPPPRNRQAVQAFLERGYLVLETVPSPHLVRELIDALEGETRQPSEPEESK